MIGRQAAIGVIAVVAILVAIVLLPWGRSARPVRGDYRVPPGATVTRFATPAAAATTLTIEAATDVSIMRPLIRAFQRRYPAVAVTYVDMLSVDLFRNAQRRCDAGAPVPDLYVSISTDHLLRLANDGCAQPVAAAAVRPAPSWARWRDEVVAFAIEPAVFVYNRSAFPQGAVPGGHDALIEMLRRDGNRWRARIGTYDIEQSGSGYIYAELDSRESPLYGRLIESLGRARTRLYCCSNTMVDAVVRGEVSIAYNVQLSYAVAALRAHAPIGIVMPADYQAILSRSAMIPRGARDSETAMQFVGFVVSAEGQAIVGAAIGIPASPGRPGGPSTDRVISQASVTPLLLRLQDQSRRVRLIREWRQALRNMPAS